MEHTIRKARLADTAAVMDIIRRTKFFRHVEEQIAEEVLDDAAGGADNSYQSYVIEAQGRVAGWVGFGETPCTLGTFDIYWLAVDPELQRAHLGSALLTFAERQIAAQHGRLMIIETSAPRCTARRSVFTRRTAIVWPPAWMTSMPRRSQVDLYKSCKTINLFG
jgi:ribosomal protein S18 acetylase RimI-like enzyme